MKVSAICYFRFIHFSIIYLLFSCAAVGQQFWQVTGEVMDSASNAPLVHVLVYITPDTAENFLAYANTDEKGTFTLNVPNTNSSVWLQIRYLGYHPKKLRINKYSNSFTKIYLFPKENNLQEVVVSDKRPPIIEKSDTTIYDLKQFRDSTEFNVEDLLKKLPGVEIKSDGSISVNGKAIDKVLVEGSDLFGRKYTLGTKNIRADFIDKVEIIDHFQENPVLKDVNLSDAVVLNLLLKEDKKNVLSGTLNVGTGSDVYGELKGSLHANVFSIAKQNKFILLTDNGNTGTQYGMNEILATYDTYNKKDIKTPIHQASEYQTFSNIQNPGLPNEFVDNSKSYLATLRSLHKVNDFWEVNVNGLFSKNTDDQRSIINQIYLFENNTYTLNTNRLLKLNNQLFGTEVQINHVSQQQNRSFQSYFKWDENQQQNELNIIESREMINNEYRTNADKKQHDWFAAGLYSQKLGSASVGQIQMKATAYRAPQFLNAQNLDFPTYFNQAEAFSILNQALSYKHQEVEFTGRFLWSGGPLLLEIEPIYSKSTSLFTNDVTLQDTSGTLITLFPEDVSEDKLMNDNIQININLQSNIRKKTALRILLKGEERRSRIIKTETTVFPSQRAFSSNITLEQTFENEAKGRMAYTYQENNPSNDCYFTIPYFSDNYTLFTPNIRSNVISGHLVNIYFGNQEEFKFRSYYINFRGGFAQQIWRDATDFNQSLLVIAPILSKNNNDFSVVGNFDQFIPKFKTNIKVNVSFFKEQGTFFVQEQPLALSNEATQLKTSFRSVFFKNITFILENNFGSFHSYQTAEKAETNNPVSVWQSGITTLFTFQNWRFSASLNKTQGRSNRNTIADLTGAQMNISKTFILSKTKKQLKIDFTAINLSNSKKYSRVENRHFFFFRSAVQAIPAFFLIKIDYAL